MHFNPHSKNSLPTILFYRQREKLAIAVAVAAVVVAQGKKIMHKNWCSIQSFFFVNLKLNFMNKS